MITANVFRRTFFIKFGNSKGTAFAIDIENRQYLITARHVVEGVNDKDKIEIYHEKTWKPISIVVVGMGKAEKLDTDIAVLATDVKLAPSHPLPATADELVFGQRVYFLGFPFGLHTTTKISNGYPIPIVKGALMSGTEEDNGTRGVVFLLDGHNNPGFSGGPVVFKSAEKHELEFKVLGVVSGFRTENIPITFMGKKTELASKANTGIIVCPSIKQATEMIRANPIGFELIDA